MKTYAVIYQTKIRSLSKQDSDDAARTWFQELGFHTGARLIVLDLIDSRVPKLGDIVSVGPHEDSKLGIGILA